MNNRIPIAVLTLLLCTLLQCTLLTPDAKAEDFVIQGTVTCVTPRGEFKLEGAEVEIFRYRQWWSDDRVDVKYTEKGGIYSVPLQADDVGEYYARVRLTDGKNVHLEEDVNSSTWSLDSPHESSDRAEIIADFRLEKEGGGAPECEIWAGVKTAYEEYKTTIGGDPPQTDYKVLLSKAVRIPFSYLATITWPENYAPGVSLPDVFGRFRTSFHEFGHTVRHSLDGDWNHLVNDASAYTYVQKHGPCKYQTGIRATAGYGFNEGWAYYWSNDGRSCPGEEDNFDLGGNVARDLLALARCSGVGRKGMVSILKQGQNIIHSQDEFRERFQATFPRCPLPPRDGSGMPIGGAISLPPPLEPAQLRATIKRNVATIDGTRKSLESKLNTLLKTPCEGLRCNDRDLRVEVTRARIATSQFALGLLRQDLNKVERGQTLSDYSLGAKDAWDIRAQRTTAARRDIVLTSLKRIEPLLKQRGDDAEAKRVAQQIQVLKSGVLLDPILLKLADVQNLQINDLDLPPAPSDSPWWRGWLIVLGVLVFVAIVLLIMRRSRPD
jgi:hypothetical protein